MRIQIVQGAENDETRLVELTTAIISEAVENTAEHSLVDTNPDVIHIIGCWNRRSLAIAKQAQLRHIALIHTPLSSLSPWHKPTSAMLKATSSATLVVASGEMEHVMLKGVSDSRLRLIRNAVVTNTTTKEEMTAAYNALYAEAYELNEAGLRQHVAGKISLLNEEDSTISTLCERFLYAHYLYQRRNIPLKYLQDLAEFMIASDYDEDHLVKLLHLLNLDTFTQELEFAMKERTNLTEGFVPIIWKDDKIAKDILSIITEYN